MKATEVTACLAESNGSLLPGLWRDSLHVTFGLTACTHGISSGPTLGNEYGKTLPFYPGRHESVHKWGLRVCVYSVACAGRGCDCGEDCMSVCVGDFRRAVKACTGQLLASHVVHVVFQLFDVDGDGKLSHKEFIAVMKDRLLRGTQVSSSPHLGPTNPYPGSSNPHPVPVSYTHLTLPTIYSV